MNKYRINKKKHVKIYYQLHAFIGDLFSIIKYTRQNLFREIWNLTYRQQSEWQPSSLPLYRRSASDRAGISQCGWQICRDLSTVPQIIVIATHRTRLFLPGVAIMILLEIHNRILEETLTNKIKHALSGWGPSRASAIFFFPSREDPLGPVLSPHNLLPGNVAPVGRCPSLFISPCIRII